MLSIILNKNITCNRAKPWNLDTIITSVYTLCPLNFKIISNGQRSNKMTSLNLYKSINNIFYDYFAIFFLNSGGNGIFDRDIIFCFIPNWILRRNLKQNVHNKYFYLIYLYVRYGRLFEKKEEKILWTSCLKKLETSSEFRFRNTFENIHYSPCSDYSSTKMAGIRCKFATK